MWKLGLVVFCIILAIALLNCAGLLGFSWWWVTAPIWVAVLLVLSVATIVGFIALVVLLIRGIW